MNLGLQVPTSHNVMSISSVVSWQTKHQHRTTTTGFRVDLTEADRKWFVMSPSRASLRSLRNT